jgi:hypothetical protein
MRFREKQKGTLSKLQVKTTGRVFSSSSFVSFVSFVSFFSFVFVRFRSFSFVFFRVRTASRWASVKKPFTTIPNALFGTTLRDSSRPPPPTGDRRPCARQYLIRII